MSYLAAATRRLLRLSETARCSPFPSNATGRPPSLGTAAVARLVTEYFPFQHVDQQSVKQFPSYDDRNFYFRGTPEHASLEGGAGTCIETQREYVLKLNNPLVSSYGVLKGINALLTHLNTKGFTKCIQPLSSREGDDVLQITKDELNDYGACQYHSEPLSGSDEIVDESARTLFMRVVSYIPGDCLDHVDKRHLTPSLLYSIGHYVGRAEAIIQVHTE